MDKQELSLEEVLARLVHNLMYLKDKEQSIEDLEIIKTALKENISLKAVVKYLQEDYAKLENKLNALGKIFKEPDTVIEKIKESESWERDYFDLNKKIKILKDKKVDIFNLMTTTRAEYYNMFIKLRFVEDAWEEHFLTDEEFDSLKEEF